MNRTQELQKEIKNQPKEVLNCNDCNEKQELCDYHYDKAMCLQAELKGRQEAEKEIIEWACNYFADNIRINDWVEFQPTQFIKALKNRQEKTNDKI